MKGIFLMEKYQSYSVVGVLLLVLCLFTTTISADTSTDKSNANTCEKDLKKISATVHFFNFSSSICHINIQPPKSNSSEVFLFFEEITLHEDDKIVVTNLSDTNEVLFEVPHPIDGVTPVFTGGFDISIQISISSAKFPRDIKFFYHSQSCSLSRDVGDDIRMLASPLYGKNVTTVQPCDYIFNQNLMKNASYVFIFEKFNIGAPTRFAVEGADPRDLALGSKKMPLDLFSSGPQVKFTMQFDPTVPSDKFLMRKEDLIGVCTQYKVVNGKDNFASPIIEEVPDGVSGECRWAFASHDGKPLGVEFTKVNFTDKLDIVSITNGGYSDVLPFYQVTALNQDEALTRRIRTNGSRIMVSFKPVSFKKSSFSFRVFNVEQGMYMQGSGQLTASGSVAAQNDTIFLLEVEKDQRVLLEFQSSSFSSPVVLNIYDDFTTNSNLLAALKGDVWYPVLSTTSKMMVHAVNFVQGSFSATFRGTAVGCMHMSPGGSDSYVLSGNCNSTCAWIIPPLNKKTDLLLDLQYIALEPSDFITVLRLDSKKSVIANITSGTTSVPAFSLDSTVGAYVKVTRGSCQKEKDIVLVAEATYMPGCSRNFTLSQYADVQLTSPNYPNTYPLLSLCQYGIKRTPETKFLLVTFDKLQLAADHCLQFNQLFSNGTSYQFSFTGDNMPDDIFYEGDAVVQFNSGKCNATKVADGKNVYKSAQGFVMNITSTDCGNIFNDKAKVFESEVNKSVCIWKVSVPSKGPDDSVNVISFSHKQKDGSGNYKLMVYDGASLRSGKLLNLTGLETWSRTNELIFIYEIEDISQPASVIIIDYKTESCNKTMQCDNKLCMHPDWLCNGVNDCGDFSDEKKCGSLPNPPVQPVTEPGSISGAVFGICVVLFFLFGIALTWAAPKVIDKLRNTRYHQFRDVSVVE